jgi:hypothetical protein
MAKNYILEIAEPQTLNGKTVDVVVANIVRASPNRVLVERFPTVDQYQVQVEAFGASVRTGAPFAWSLENAKGTQAMIDWAYRVAEEVRL